MALYENKKIASSGKLTFSKESKPVKKVITFIQNNLPQFAQEFKSSTVQNENGLTQEFCDILNANASDNLFWFAQETMEDTSNGTSPRVDVGVKTKKRLVIRSQTVKPRKCFFKIEAKRLPTGSGREKEYVIGNKKINGGIQRFKEGKHAPDLPSAGLIAFVQKNSFNHWHTEVNNWIKELIKIDNHWHTNDELILDATFKSDTFRASYLSKSKRRGEKVISKSIILYHFWVRLF